jgi:hypothetical protein
MRLDQPPCDRTNHDVGGGNVQHVARAQCFEWPLNIWRTLLQNQPIDGLEGSEFDLGVTLTCGLQQSPKIVTQRQSHHY